MVAEWVDCGVWEAWDDGGGGCIKITNHHSSSTLALTVDGLIFAGAAAGIHQVGFP